MSTSIESYSWGFLPFALTAAAGVAAGIVIARKHAEMQTSPKISTVAEMIGDTPLVEEHS